ncbi:uncharacterized protein LOC120077412 [Benincasa hispida]|uniref:uncharacterized protein LOC120077412 n=1 Tax=Benincasa hispida TaxID=102211 RepID=UPI0019025F61|nr:uncharacterized protein LOC120077412 [Benincasa hispida]
MPMYAKFLKDIITKKISIGKYEMVALTYVSNAISPPKMRDPGSFTIPCSIRGIYIGQAICDLESAIAVHLEGKLEDVLVKVDKFILPAHFIILDYEVHKDVPIILGRPFHSTERAQIDVHKGEIAMNVNGQKLKFNIIKAMSYPDEAHSFDVDEEWPCS